MHDFNGIALPVSSVCNIRYPEVLGEIATSLSGECETQTPKGESEAQITRLQQMVDAEALTLGINTDAYRLAASYTILKGMYFQGQLSPLMEGLPNSLEPMNTVLQSLPLPDLQSHLQTRDLGKDFKRMIPILLLSRLRTDLHDAGEETLPNFDGILSLIPERFRLFAGSEDFELAYLLDGYFPDEFLLETCAKGIQIPSSDLNYLIRYISYIDGVPFEEIKSRIMESLESTSIRRTFIEKDDYLKSVILALVGVNAIEDETRLDDLLEKIMHLVIESLDLNIIDSPLYKHITPQAIFGTDYHAQVCFMKYVSIFIPRKTEPIIKARSKFRELCGLVTYPE